MTFAPGENVGAYRIIEQLGQGGMATVFKAYHAALDRFVAIKVLHPAFKQDPSFLARFTREARIVARLIHPNIVPVYDFNEHEGMPYLVMRYIEGQTLKARRPSPFSRVSRNIRLQMPSVMPAFETAAAKAYIEATSTTAGAEKLEKAPSYFRAPVAARNRTTPSATAP